MALKKEAITKLATLAKLDEKAFLEAISATDEKDITIADDLNVMTKVELETRDRNQYEKGKTAGSEMTMKDFKTKTKVDIEGTDPEKIAEAIGKKAVEEAKIAPDEQVKEQKKLVDQWKVKASTAEEKIKTLETEKTQLSTDNKIRGLFPKDRSDILTDDEFLMSVKGKYNLEIRDGKEVVIDRTTSEIVKDPTKLEPVAPGDVVKKYFTERKWITDPGTGGGGRGGGNSNPGSGGVKFVKLSEAKAWVESQGKNINGTEGQAMMQAAIKENPGIDMTA